jgi:hypothetical protein
MTRLFVIACTTPTEGCPIPSAFFALGVGGNTVDSELPEA